MTDSSQRVLDTIAALDAHHNFVARDGSTFCNQYAAVLCHLLGAPLPFLATANQQAAWLSGVEGTARGWQSIDKSEALILSNLGHVVVAVATGEPHGHIGVIVPSLPGDEMRLYVSAAGTENFVRAPLGRSFGQLHPLFYVYRGTQWPQSSHS